MSDLTAADLARLDALAEAVTSPARRTEYGELWVRASPRPRCDDDAVVVTRQDIAALVATVRALARVIVDVGDSITYCPICSGMLLSAGDIEHESDCPVLVARALMEEGHTDG